MAAKLSKGLDEQVTCPICLEHYSDPRLLPCLHTYCRKCLQDLLAKAGKSKASGVCPECREEVQIISGDVTKLKVNFWINNLLSLLAIYSTERRKDGGKTELTCENCDMKETATRRCVNCCMFLCDFCSTAHKRYVATKGHQLMTLDQIKDTGIPVMEKQLFCEKHKGEVKKLFCITCQELICRDCTIIDHRDHEFSFVEDVADQHKQLFKTEVERASNTKNKIEAVLKSVQEMKENVEKTSKDTEKDVDKFIDEQIRGLEEKRIVLKQETRKIAATKMKELAAQEDGLAMHLTGLKSAIEFTEKVLTNGGSSDVLSISKQLTSRLSQLSKKPFLNYPCQGDKIRLTEFDKNQFHTFIHCANVVDACIVDNHKCSVTQRIGGRLVENQGLIQATQGQLLDFVVQIKNSFGDIVKFMADRIKAKLSYSHGKESILPINSLPDNTYSFDVKYVGQSNIHVMVDGKNISGSPINIQEQVDYDECSVAQRIDGRLVENQDLIQATQGQLLDFVVQIKNSFGDKMKFMADRIKAKLSYSHGKESILPINSLPDNTYAFSVKYAGRCNISVLVDGKNISGSPINIQEPVDYDKCSVAQRIDGRLVNNLKYAHATHRGQVLDFVVHIKNSVGKKLKFMANRIQAKLSYSHGNESILPINSLPNNTYTFSVTYGGRSNIHVMVDGRNISGSPINIHRQAQNLTEFATGQFNANVQLWSPDEYLNVNPMFEDSGMYQDGLVLEEDEDIWEEEEICCPQDACYPAQNVGYGGQYANIGNSFLLG